MRVELGVYGPRTQRTKPKVASTFALASHSCCTHCACPLLVAQCKGVSRIWGHGFG